MAKLGISVIVTTYNWPGALDRVLSGLSKQQYECYEIIVADDGSTEQTQKIIEKWQQHCPVPIQHCWQPDEGFRASMIRNRAAAKAQYDYLLFLDGDCVPRRHFVRNHAHLAQTGYFVKGNRILLKQAFTEWVLNNDTPIEKWSMWQWYQAWLQKNINRFLPLVTLPLMATRRLFGREWEGVKTCNLGVWRSDYIAVNGLDEQYVGWGFEDSDLVIRLQRQGILRKSGQCAVGVLHLWHPEQNRAQEQENIKRLQRTLQQTHIRASKGIEQYLSCQS